MSHLSDARPGSSSRLPARSWLHTDAASLSLDGTWRFRLHDADPADDSRETRDLQDPGLDDSDWSDLAVPAHWVLHGHGAPIYTNLQYPFPIDPPHVPDENPTGDYRRSFEVPSSFAGSRILLRFDGVESLATVWLNGSEIGWTTGSRLATEFDVTDYVVAGANHLAVRVNQWSAASYLEDQDQWWLPGIFRSVTLLSRPAQGIDDVDVRASFDPVSSEGTLDLDVTGSFPITVRAPKLGIDVTWASPADARPIVLLGVDAWTVETPVLYDIEVSSPGENVALRVGFRTVQIVDDAFLVNGRRVTFRGVNLHESRPERGRVFDEAEARADLVLMKQHNVNAIRTSHYPPHPRLLDLADELGFWVVLECDLETHGFWDVEWVDNPSDDPRWRDALLDRIERTVERDKNHPSIVLWSLGNESGTGRNLAAMSSWLRRRDPSRPIHYEGDLTGEYTDVYSRMYPTLEEIDSVCGGGALPIHETEGTHGARQRSKPFLLCEYAHAMGNGPGSFADYEERVDRHPRLHGAFVWEWRDHGLLSRAPDGSPFYAYGGDFGEIVHDGAFVMDGLLLSDGTPTPSLAEFAAVIAPVRVRFAADSPGYGPSAGGARLTVENRRHTATTADIRLHWLLERNGRLVAEGNLDYEPKDPGAVSSLDLSAPLEAAAGLPADAAHGELSDELFLTVRAELREATAWAPAGHVVSADQRAVPLGRPVVGSSSRARSLRSTGEWDGDRLGAATFSSSGDLVSLQGLAVAGPLLELFRAPTDNDRGASSGSYEIGDPLLTQGRGAEEEDSSAARWLERGLDRLSHRVVSVARTENGLTRRVRVGAAQSSMGVDVHYRWELTNRGLLLQTDVQPVGPWDCTWPRLGLRFDLPLSLAGETVSWFGSGPAESYADSSQASRLGRFSAAVDELNVVYARPQETGHRPDLRRLSFGSLDIETVPGPDGRRTGFQLSLHTPQAIDRAGHPHELPKPGFVHLILDRAQHGLGSRACGPDVLPRHALWPRADSWDVLFL